MTLVPLEGVVTDQLPEGQEEIVCWTCGGQVVRYQVEQTVSILKNLYSDIIMERSSLREEKDEREADHKRMERTGQKREELRRELEDVETKFKAKTARIEDFEADA